MNSPISSFIYANTCFFLGTIAGYAVKRVVGGPFHELGHMIAIKTLFPYSLPKMSIDWVNGRYYTEWDESSEPRFRKISIKTCKGIIAAAGPIFDFINITTSHAIAYKYSSTSPFLSCTLITNGMCEAIHLLEYSASTVCKGHDFCNISENLNISRKSLHKTALAVNAIGFIFLLINFCYIFPSLQNPT